MRFRSVQTQEFMERPGSPIQKEWRWHVVGCDREAAQFIVELRATSPNFIDTGFDHRGLTYHERHWVPSVRMPADYDERLTDDVAWVMDRKLARVSEVHDVAP